NDAKKNKPHLRRIPNKKTTQTSSFLSPPFSSPSYLVIVSSLSSPLSPSLPTFPPLTSLLLSSPDLPTVSHTRSTHHTLSPTRHRSPPHPPPDPHTNAFLKRRVSSRRVSLRAFSFSDGNALTTITTTTTTMMRNHEHNSTATATDDGDEEEEEDEEETKNAVVEEESEEWFYESLDRILSSSNPSTSGSDSDPDDNSSSSRNHRRHRSRNSVTWTGFPLDTRSCGAWITESFDCSVEQRRDRLLQALGLGGDVALSRRDGRGVGGSGRVSDSSRLVSVDEGNCGGSGSKSKGPTDFELENERLVGARSCSNRSSCFGSHVVYNSNDAVVDEKRSDEGTNSSVGDDFAGDGLELNKVRTSRTNKIHGESGNVTPKCGCGEDVECDRDEEDAGERMCTIKNLDNGKEFVVNEVREDGMWKKLREVGTGRQLTMEEFEMCVGHSPIVQELMRRQNVEERGKGDRESEDTNGSGENGLKLKKKVSWLKSIKNVTSSVKVSKERRSSDERDTSSDKGGRRSSSATDDSQDVLFHGPEKIRVRQYGKPVKEISALYRSQEIQAHTGSIWTIRFSLDGRFLASAGEDCVIHVWQVVESERKGELLMDRPDDGSLNLSFGVNGSPEPSSNSPKLDSPVERKRRGRTSISRKSLSVDHIVVPEMIFGLLEKPICSFRGHLDDVLDLSWSKSQLLLSSSMDKTVRLWNLFSKTCLKVFSHSDYVTCIQFNPVDDRYFISGSLDAKVRIWSIPDRQVVDWNDLHEMVTAACYTPDGQGALVGSYKGNCRLYNTSENKLQQKAQINLQNKKKKAHLKKITGFQFSPGSSSEVLITSADSRVRVIDGVDLVHKFKGSDLLVKTRLGGDCAAWLREWFRNTNSQISAAISANGKYVISASEDSHVYVWKHESDSRPSRSKSVTVTRSYEHFHCQDVYVAIPWPGMGDSFGPQDSGFREQNGAYHYQDEISSTNHPPSPVENEDTPSASACNHSPLHRAIAGAANSYFFDRIAATWPEEKLLLAAKNRSPHPSLDFSNGVMQNRTAWGMVIVTAGLRGRIRTFQNFGLPIRT
ncbi:WD repeat-containing protein, partial [Drosera capensis]